MKARLIKRGGEITRQNNLQAMRQSGHSQLEAQALALTGIAAVRAEVQTRMTTSRHQKREQAREHFNNLFTGAALTARSAQCRPSFFTARAPAVVGSDFGRRRSVSLLPESQIDAASKGRSARALRPRVDFYTDLQKETEMELRTECALGELQELRRDGYSVFMRGGVPVHYIIDLGDYAFVKIEPIQGVFDVEMNVAKFADADDEVIGVVRGEAYMAQPIKTLEPTIEDAQKTFDEREINIRIPDGLVKELSERRRAFFESEAYAETMHMAATESGDSDGRLTPEEVEMIYGPDERLRLFGSVPAEGD